MGTSNTNGWNGASTAPTLTLTGVVAGSWLYVATGEEAGTTSTPVANTTEIREDLNVGADNSISIVGVNTTGTSGNISVGWSTASTYGQVAALEIKKL
jgi:hypothetical protein